jgi:hypothetical protein
MRRCRPVFPWCLLDPVFRPMLLLLLLNPVARQSLRLLTSLRAIPPAEHVIPARVVVPARGGQSGFPFDRSFSSPFPMRYRRGSIDGMTLGAIASAEETERAFPTRYRTRAARWMKVDQRRGSESARRRLCIGGPDGLGQFLRAIAVEQHPVWVAPGALRKAADRSGHIPDLPGSTVVSVQPFQLPAFVVLHALESHYDYLTGHPFSQRDEQCPSLLSRA